MTVDSSSRRIALCHEWLTTYGGSDVCAARIADLLDVGSIFTFTMRDSLALELFRGRNISTVKRWTASRVVQDRWQWFLPLMPRAWGSLDLSRFDLVVTSSHACTNAIMVPDGVPHVSYCYTPMRYAWQPELEMARLPALVRPLWPPAAAALRRADKRWAKRVDGYIAISHTVAARIEACYGRSATVVYPPVDTDFFTPGDGQRTGDFFLAAGRLVAYKGFDIAVRAFGELGYPLLIAGSGPELDGLRARAPKNVRFEVDPPAEVLRDLYRNARALVFPGVEDFGMVPVEAQACGTPVIALGAGGATETVVDRVTGVLYSGGSSADLVAAVRRFEQLSFDASAIRAGAERFATGVFDSSFLQAVDAIVADHASRRK